MQGSQKSFKNMCCLKNKCKGILVKAALSKTQLSSLNPFFLEDFQEDWAACETALIYSYYLLHKTNLSHQHIFLKNNPLYPIINQVPMSLLKTLHIVKPGSIWALDFWNYIKGRQKTCEVCCSQRQDQLSQVTRKSNPQQNTSQFRWEFSPDLILGRVWFRLP